MGLRDQAERDLAFLIEDSVAGFGWPITVATPADAEFPLVGLSSDIARMIDPETGMVVVGRTATVALRASSVDAAGHGRPVGIADAAVKPWRVTFNDLGGAPHTFKVVSVDPDETLGVLLCVLGGLA